MDLTDFGRNTLDRPLQPEKAKLPRVVTELGMVMLDRPLQPRYLQLVVGQWIPVKMVEK